MCVMHVGILGANFLFIGLYELSFLLWATGNNTETENLNTNQLAFLSFCELAYNISNVFSMILLGFMMDKMTDCCHD